MDGPMGLACRRGGCSDQNYILTQENTSKYHDDCQCEL